MEAAPSATKFHAAPCQRPASPMVTSRSPRLAPGTAHPSSRRAGCRGSRVIHDESEMCQRRQKSAVRSRQVRRRKFSDSSKPSSRALPRAMSV